MTACDLCDDYAEFRMYAAYPIASNATHPRLARYPAPMYRLCGTCLPEGPRADRQRHGATPGYYIEEIR